jgi:hypothetical protein
MIVISLTLVPHKINEKEKEKHTYIQQVPMNLNFPFQPIHIPPCHQQKEIQYKNQRKIEKKKIKRRREKSLNVSQSNKVIFQFSITEHTQQNIRLNVVVSIELPMI